VITGFSSSVQAGSIRWDYEVCRILSRILIHNKACLLFWECNCTKWMANLQPSAGDFKSVSFGKWNLINGLGDFCIFFLKVLLFHCSTGSSVKNLNIYVHRTQTRSYHSKHFRGYRINVWTSFSSVNFVRDDYLFSTFTLRISS